MFDHKHYVPVLKGKRAEFPTLENLKSKDGLTPLMEAVPTAAPDFVPRKMSGCWPGDKPYFLDLLFLDDEDMEEKDAKSHPLVKCFDDVANRKAFAIPVTGTGRSPAYQSALKSITESQGNGYAIRLVTDDFEDEDELGDAIQALVKLIGVPRAKIDLIVDADSVAEMSASTVSQMHRANLTVLPTIEKWRTLTVLGGSFPLSMAPLTRGIWNSAPRNDWHGWRQLIRKPKDVARLPAYGDYAIAHPDLPPTGRATILAQLRYTTPDDYLVWKGHNVFTHPRGYEQFIDICRDMVKRPEYRGPKFSHGDEQISEKATTGDSPGNAETWRKIGTNHHCETVLDQIANFPWP
jgi:hypothetical protein